MIYKIIVPKMSKQTKAVRGLIGALIIIALSTVIFVTKTSKPDLMVAFTGYTNSATGVLSANFIVSNIAGQVVYVSEKGFVQRKERGEWIQTGQTNSRVIGLQPGEAFVVNVLKPTNCEAWRIFLTSGRPRSSVMRRIGNLYERQPFQFQPLSYLILAPVLRQTVNYGGEIQN